MPVDPNTIPRFQPPGPRDERGPTETIIEPRVCDAEVLEAYMDAVGRVLETGPRRHQRGALNDLRDLHDLCADGNPTAQQLQDWKEGHVA